MKKLKYIALGIVAIGIVIAAIFVLKPKQTSEIDVDFLNVDPTFADSMIKVMTLEEKVAQVIIYNNDTLNNYNFAGYSIFADSISEFALNYRKISDSSKIIPFIVNDNILFPTFYNKYFSVPNFQSVSSISDSILIDELIHYKLYIDTNFNYNFYKLTTLNNIIDSSITDTNIINLYFNITSKIASNLDSQNVIISAPALYFSSDTIRNKIIKDIYAQLIKQGLNSIYLSDYKQLNNDFYANFGGIIVSNDDIFVSFEDFLNSNIDILSVNNSSENAYNQILKLAKSKKKYKKLLDEKVKKILLAKTWLNNKKQQSTISLTTENFMNINTEVLFRKIKQKSIILLKNKNNLVPITNINKQTECLIFSKNNNFKLFSDIIKKYNPVSLKIVQGNPTNELKKIKISGNKNIIIIIDSLSIDTAFSSALFPLDTTFDLIIINIANTNNLQYLSNFSHLIHTNDTSNITQSYLAQAIYGGIEISGKIPQFINDSITFKQGFYSPKTRLGYDIPEMVGLDSKNLMKIDSIAYDAIQKWVFPGCEVFLAKDGVIFWQKAYGYIDYGRSIRVTNNTLYDIASVTKIAATTLSAMKMYEQGRLNLDTKIKRYFNDTHIDYSKVKHDTSDYVVKIDTLNILIEPNWEKLIKGTDTTWIDDTLLESIDTIKFDVAPTNNIFQVTARQLLMHQSGIQPALPILGLMLLDDAKFERIRDVYADTLDTTSQLTFRQKWDVYYVNHYIKDSAETKVAAGMYLKNNYRDSLWEDTKLLKVWYKKVYVYSDVNMILLQTTIDSINNYSISKYVRNKFYYPLGLKYITYKPLNSFSRSHIAPTERDNYWRQQTIWGNVHDPSAACLGGVAGNAGIFSNAFSLGVIGQMLLNGGTYGGQRFLNKSTIDKFTATQPNSHRGLGFDKWSQKQIIAHSASVNSYGHTGFTGTCIWNDPDNDIVFVFLSNRVHPSARNWKINKYKIRQKIHQTVYDSFISEQ